MKSSSTCPLLILTKLDQVLPQGAYKLKNCIIKDLTERWPGEDPESQIISISSSNESNAQILGETSNDATCASLINGISSMVLKGS